MNEKILGFYPDLTSHSGKIEGNYVIQVSEETYAKNFELIRKICLWTMHTNNLVEIWVGPETKIKDLNFV